jgi:hypothetical protein
VAALRRGSARHGAVLRRPLHDLLRAELTSHAAGVANG